MNSLATSASALERFRLDDRVAIVTGASSGLGVVFSLALADAGADLVLVARRADRLEDTSQLVNGRGRRAIVVPADVSQPQHAQRVIDAAMQEYGRVDVLVNNAGKTAAVPSTRETPDQFRAIIDTNLNGCYWMAQACGRVMQPGSAIVNVASVLATTSIGLPQAAYTASKAGLIGLTRDLAAQWTGRKGIRVNALSPGVIASEMTDQLPQSHIDALRSRILVGRVGDPQELTGALLLLTSPAGDYITGTVITVDGGITVT